MKSIWEKNGAQGEVDRNDDEMFSFQLSSKHPSHSPQRSLKCWALTQCLSTAFTFLLPQAEGPPVPEGLPPQRCRLSPLRERTAWTGPGHSQARRGHGKQESRCRPHGTQGKGNPAREPEPHSRPDTRQDTTLTLLLLQQPIPEGTCEAPFHLVPDLTVRWVGQVALTTGKTKVVDRP